MRYIWLFLGEVGVYGFLACWSFTTNIFRFMTDGRLTFWGCFYIPIYLPLNLLPFLLLKPLFEGESVCVEKAATFPGNEPLTGCTTDHLNPKCRTSTSRVAKQFMFPSFLAIYFDSIVPFG